MNFFKEALLFGSSGSSAPEDAFVKFQINNGALSPLSTALKIPSAILEASEIPRMGTAGLFAGCTMYNGDTSNQKITFPNLQSIGDYGMVNAFVGAGPRFTILDFPVLTTVGSYAFMRAFMSAMFHDAYFESVQTIGAYAFAEAWAFNQDIGGWSEPTTMVFNEVTTIGDYAFMNAFSGARCLAATNTSHYGGGAYLAFPKVVSIGTSAFYGVFNDLLTETKYGVTTNKVKLPLQFSSMLADIGLVDANVEYYDYRTDGETS